MFSVLIATCSSDLTAALHRGPHSAVTQLRVIPLCESSFLKVHLAWGMTLWVPTHVPQPLVIRPESVSTFLSYHARNSPLGVALSWVVSAPGSPIGGMGTSRVRLLSTGTRTMALKPPFSSFYYCSGLRLNPTMLQPGDTLFWRRLLLATPRLGDASLWRRLLLAMPRLGDASLWRCLLLATPYLGDALSFILVISSFYNYLSLKLKKRVNIKFEKNCLRDSCSSFKIVLRTIFMIIHYT